MTRSLAPTIRHGVAIGKNVMDQPSMDGLHLGLCLERAGHSGRQPDSRKRQGDESVETRMCSTSLRRHRDLAAQRQHFRCWYCGFPMWHRDPTPFAQRHGLTVRLARRFCCTAEHLKARSDGGSDRSDNIVAACIYCNRMRHKRKVPRDPEDHRSHVARRVRLGRWHPSQAHCAFAASQD